MDKCVICNSNNYSVIHKRKQHKLLKCKSCGLVKTYPVPRVSYKESADYFPINEIPLFNIYAKELLDIVLKYKKSGNFLDVGCGIGLLIKQARDYGFNVTGTELSKIASSYGKEKFHLNIHSNELADCAFAPLNFDVITLVHVFEHITEPFLFLKEIKRILKPDGVVIFSVPNMESLSVKLFLPFLTGINLKDHVYHFTKHTLKKLLSINSFTILKTIIKDPYQPYSRSLKGFLKKIICAPFYALSDKLGMGRNLFIVVKNADI